MALWVILAMGLGLMARPAEAAPFAYVANVASNSVSVIDTATNTVVATIPVRAAAEGLAVTPDGTHVYVTNISSDHVSVIATATNTVVATVAVGSYADGVAVTPDGTHVYVA
ncbi:MAG: YncE family protein, partial [Methylocella sp.]